jgi:proline iminopeptidase
MSTAQGYVTTDSGVRLFFKKVGAGPKTLIVLNGFYLSDDFAYLAGGRSVVFLDLRNRGRSNHLIDEAKLGRGVLNDVDDIEAVRRHFGLNRIDLLAHSYAAKTVILYAIEHGAHVGRVVQIGASPPAEGRRYPPHLTCDDATLREFFDKASRLAEERAALDPKVFCRRFWRLLRPIYVTRPEDADKLRWDHCDLPTESTLGDYWSRYLLPSIQKVSPTPGELQDVSAPVLIVHGTKDRSAPFGGAREWAMALPNARLLAVDNVAHAPWIEAPEEVLGPIETFLDGDWPHAAQRVTAL